MELHERMRELRKNHLHLSQTDFEKRLDANRDVIGNIEQIQLDTNSEQEKITKTLEDKYKKVA